MVTHYQQPETFVTQGINGCGTELQVMKQSEETTTRVVPRPFSEEDPETPATHTVFVRHGQVISN